MLSTHSSLRKKEKDNRLVYIDNYTVLVWEELDLLSFRKLKDESA